MTRPRADPAGIGGACVTEPDARVRSRTDRHGPRDSLSEQFKRAAPHSPATALTVRRKDKNMVQRSSSRRGVATVQPKLSEPTALIQAAAVTNDVLPLAHAATLYGWNPFDVWHSRVKAPYDPRETFVGGRPWARTGWLRRALCMRRKSVERPEELGELPAYQLHRRTDSAPPRAGESRRSAAVFMSVAECAEIPEGIVSARNLSDQRLHP